ncbi:MAG TPA: polymer-forming cytoskeletal protein [Vicinamibacterales bacterium]
MAGESLRIKGDITAEEDLRFEGHIEGTITVPGHTLFVGPQARINATVQAKTIIVAGTLTGAVTANERFELQEHGCLEGTLESPRISVREGATLRAKVTMPERRKDAGAKDASAGPSEAQRSVA